MRRDTCHTTVTAGPSPNHRAMIHRHFNAQALLSICLMNGRLVAHGLGRCEPSARVKRFGT